MCAKETAEYGSWRSPIRAEQVAAGTIGLCDVRLEGRWVYWQELRPAEGGRHVVVRRGSNGRTTDMTPEGFNARTRVHEYGGAAYLAVGEAVTFVNFTDQRLYSYDGKNEPEPVVPEKPVRYADLVYDRPRRRLIAVREDHSGAGEAVNTIATVMLGGEARPVALAQGNDFYAAPRLSPDAKQLAWLTWNHPDMPWDAAELWVAPLKKDGSLGRARHVAGGPDEAVCEPVWSPDGVLHFVSDRTDWWNIYRAGGGKVEAVTQLEAEFACPHWWFGQSHYAFDGPRKIVCSYVQDGRWRLATVDARGGRPEPIDTPFGTIGWLCVAGGRAVFVAGAPAEPAAVVMMDLAGGETTVLRRASEFEIDARHISEPKPVTFPTENGQTAHGFFYPPRNKDHTGPKGRKPPLVVKAHGGPTWAASTSLRLDIQYYTSRGVAVLDVDYGGSSGYGRAYRGRLCGQWGLVDVDDCCNGAKYLAGRGLVDGGRMAITGGSAGGYTTLSCLVFRDVFAAGASHFGVSDCEVLAKETHKFESRYLGWLIGPYPEARDLYRQRSPIHHVDGLSCPVVFFQGIEDQIVPPDQARLMAEALGRKELPVALVEFPDEQHGFRHAENIQRAMEGELYFFSRIFGFTPADHIKPLAIDNLPDSAL